MEKIGFKHGDTDSTVYFCFKDNNSIEIAGWYVDNGPLAANSHKSMERMVHDIKESFEIQDLGSLDHLLGIKITRDQGLGTIHISQPSFINTIYCTAIQHHIREGHILSDGPKFRS